MNSAESPLFWSFPCGTWFQTRIRISFYFPLIVFVVCLRLEDLRLGLLFSAILFFSVLAHEFGHVVAARMTGGGGDDILIWPLGGLAAVFPASTFSSRFLTAAAGPLVNLALCGITFPAVLQSGLLAESLHPLTFPLSNASALGVQDTLVLAFAANWILLLVNLIPVYPLDGGRMLQAALFTRWNSETAAEIYVRVGFLAGFVMLVCGLMFDSSWVVAIGAFILLLNMQESFRMRSTDSYDESFMGYDFSQGYTSLERSGEPSAERPPGLIQQWKMKRRAEKQRRVQAKDVIAQQQLDELLQKVHSDGIESLSEAERRQLRRASDRFRQRNRR